MTKKKIWICSSIALGIFAVLYLLLFFHLDVVIFVDLSSGKMKSEEKAFGITVDVDEFDSRLTEITKDLNVEYDAPRWKVISSFQKNIFGKIVVWECYKSGQIGTEINNFATVLSLCNLDDDDKRNASAAFVHWMNTGQYEITPSEVFMESIQEAYKNKLIPPDGESPFFDTSNPVEKELFDDFVDQVYNL